MMDVSLILISVGILRPCLMFHNIYDILS